MCQWERSMLQRRKHGMTTIDRPCVLKMQKNRQENSLKYHSGASSLERKYRLNLAENSLQKRKTFTPLATANSPQAFL